MQIQKVSIPKPCRQDWQQMTPVEQGHHCHLCGKVVTDFSRMTNGEIVNYLAQHSNTCGRFMHHQLDDINRGLNCLGSNTDTGWRKWVMTFVLFGSTMFYGASGQSKTALPTKIEQVPVNKPNMGDIMIGKVAVNNSPKFIVISGRVVDEINEPFPGATVSFISTNRSVLTDVNGNFKLTVPDTTKQIRVDYLGYTEGTIILSGAVDTVYQLKMERRIVEFRCPGGIRPPFFKRVYYKFIKQPFGRIIK